MIWMECELYEYGGADNMGNRTGRPSRDSFEARWGWPAPLDSRPDTHCATPGSPAPASTRTKSHATSGPLNRGGETPAPGVSLSILALGACRSP